MNREEWYIKYQAARLLLNARYYRGGSNSRIDYDSPARKEVWDITYKAMYEMGGEVAQAVFHSNGRTYNISDNKWAVRFNTTVFNRKNPIRESKKKWIDRY